MKAVIQRVTSASVTNVHKNKVVGKISNGLFVLVGFKKDDTNAQIIQFASKLKKLRIFEQTEGKMTSSVVDMKFPILLVSQFTLLANTKDGNRPSFLDAESPVRAQELYDLLRVELEKDCEVQIGSFGEYMTIEAALDGPVTIVMEI